MKSLFKKIIFLSFTCVFASGGFDNGTAIRKGIFQLDLTWNPFDKINYGQSYAVLAYGFTDNLNFHGYLSKHAPDYYTWYSGLLYQFYRNNNLDLSTAFGIRKRIDKNWTDIFLPQILYTIRISDKTSVGGSIVNVSRGKIDNSLGTSLDIGVTYKLPINTKFTQSISITIGGFHPATWEPKSYFLPTYSFDILFK